MAGGYPHVLGEQELFHLADLPLQVFLIGGCNRDQQVHKVKIFIVGKPFLQEIAAADGAVDIVKVRVGIAGVLDPGAVDAQLLAHLLDDALLGLSGEEHVQVDPVTGIDHQAEPAGRHMGLIAVRGDQQVGVIKPVNADVPPVGKVNASGRNKFPGRDMVNVRFPSVCQVLCHHLFCPDGEGLCGALIPAQEVIEHVYGELVLVVWQHHFIPALAQVIRGRVDGGLQGADGLPFLVRAPCAIPGLVFKDQKETARDSLAGTDLLDELQVILLHEPALSVGLLGHLPAHRVHVAPDIRTAGQHLELELYGAYF